MITSQNLGIYRGIFQKIFPVLRGKKIINPPANILFASFPEITPPRVGFSLFWEKRAKRIDPSGTDDILKIISFCIGKSRISRASGSRFVAFWIGKIDFCVSDIEVATDENRFFSGKMVDVLEKHTIPKRSVVQAFELGFGVWSVHGHKIKLVVFRRNHASLGIFTDDGVACTGFLSVER